MEDRMTEYRLPLIVAKPPHRIEDFIEQILRELPKAISAPSPQFSTFYEEIKKQGHPLINVVLVLDVPPS